jgi:hypothetical protein
MHPELVAVIFFIRHFIIIYRWGYYQFIDNIYNLWLFVGMERLYIGYNLRLLCNFFFVKKIRLPIYLLNLYYICIQHNNRKA